MRVRDIQNMVKAGGEYVKIKDQNTSAHDLNRTGSKAGMRMRKKGGGGGVF
jgi:hypothetical protein